MGINDKWAKKVLEAIKADFEESLKEEKAGKKKEGSVPEMEKAEKPPKFQMGDLVQWTSPGGVDMFKNGRKIEGILGSSGSDKRRFYRLEGEITGFPEDELRLFKA